MKPAASLAYRTIEGETFIMDSKRRVLHSLNGTGTVVWQGLRAGLSLEAIAGRLSRDFDVPQADALGDVRGFVEGLKTKGLLVD